MLLVRDVKYLGQHGVWTKIAERSHLRYSCFFLQQSGILVNGQAQVEQVLKMFWTKDQQLHKEKWSTCMSIASWYLGWIFWRNLEKVTLPCIIAFWKVAWKIKSGIFATCLQLVTPLLFSSSWFCNWYARYSVGLNGVLQADSYGRHRAKVLLAPYATDYREHVTSHQPVKPEALKCCCVASANHVYPLRLWRLSVVLVPDRWRL